MLGDILHDDLSYTGDDGGPLSLDFARNKVREFQATMNAVSEVEQSLRETLAVAVFDESTADIADDIQLALEDFNSRRGQWQTAVSSINSASQALDAIGVRMPSVSAPGGLGFVQIPISIAALIAGAAVLIAWGIAWMQTAKSIQLGALDRISDPAKRDQIAGQIATTDNALISAQNPVSQIAGMAKWVVILGLAWLGYKTFSEMRG